MSGYEIWKDAPGYEGSYQVSSLGRVRSMSRVLHYRDGRTRTLTGRIIRLRTDMRGFKSFLAGAGNSCFVHRLVATAFVPNPKAYTKIAFKNGIKSDCRADNLEWVSQPFKRTRIQTQDGLFHTESQLNWLV